MRRRAIVCLAGIFVICLSVVCMLRYGRQDAGYRFQKRQEECRTKRDAGQGIEQKTAQGVIQQKEQEWVVKEDVQGSAMGYNLSYLGHFLLEVEEEDSLFVAGRELCTGVAIYGGEDVPEQEEYNIYRLKDGVWSVLVSHPPESVNDDRITNHCWGDKTFVSNLVYHDGFLYYNLLYDANPDLGVEKPRYIYRIPIQGGEAEKLALAWDTFCIYNGKIYYIGVENGKYSYWEMKLDGTDRRAVYRRKREWRHRSFTVGGGCLYVEEADGNGITGVNLENGDMKYYSASGMKNMERLYYENGCLYILTDDIERDIYCMDVVYGEKEQLAGDVGYSIWLGSGYLYYMWYDNACEKWNLSVLDLETGQLSTEMLVEEGGEYLEIVSNDLVIRRSVYDKDWSKEKDFYYKYKAHTLPLERLDRREVLAENP